MSISAEKYVIKNKLELLKLYSAFQSGLELDLALDSNIKEEDLQKRACFLACLSHKEKDFSLNFSLDKEVKHTKSDQTLSEELYSVVLCEEQVKIGKLHREGDLYLSESTDDFKSIPKYKKYIRVK